jgi:SGNH domain (fused to AT3 domains)
MNARIRVPATRSPRLLAGPAGALTLMLVALITSPTAFGQVVPAGPGNLALQRVVVRSSRGTLEWSVRTASPWEASDVSPDGERRICLTLWAGDRAAARARLCLDGGTGRLALRAQELTPDGSAITEPTLDASVTRAGDRDARAAIRLRAVGLDESVIYWQASSSWGPCASGCEARVPAVGKRTLDLRPAPRALPTLLAPRSHADSRDAGESPLDIREFTFAQQDIHLVLMVRTQGRWTVRDLDRGSSLCVLIGRTTPARLCVVDRSGAAALSLQPGPEASARPVAATVSLRGGRTLRATVLPSALGLARGSLWWTARTHWVDDGSCAAGCDDRVPDSGAFRTSVSALGTPRCFGAAARSSRRLCRNASLRSAAYPRPADAAIWPTSPCTPLERLGAVFDPCAFGVPEAQSRATIALVGDSHAAHWRAALEVVAQAKGWRGISITRPGCPFSTQIPASPALGPASCTAQHAATIAWLQANHAIHTVFVSDWAEPPSGPQGGIGGYGGSASAYGAMLDRLPASVQHVYVLRDVPGTTLRATLCVERLLRRRRPIGTACASSRSAVVTADPGAVAAAARGPRARVLDLTRFFCSASRCFPVVGGVYVHKDDNHMNAVFASTLGPFVLRALGAPA